VSDLNTVRGWFFTAFTEVGIMNPFSMNLNKIIKERNLRILDLAKAIGVSPSTLSDWTAGANPRDLQKVKKLANYLNLSLDELVSANHKVAPNTKQRLSQKEIPKSKVPFGSYIGF